MAEPAREIVHAFLDDDRKHVVVIERIDGVRRRRTVRAEFVTWHRAADVPKDMRQAIRALDYFRGMRVVGSWLRCSWRGEDGRHNARRGFKAYGVDVFEGDVDPTLLWLAEDGSPIARPRRCYLDVEADSRVPLTRKEEMRILSWALLDHETGEEIVGVLEHETDEDEARLLSDLARALAPYDQICVWEGDWPGGEFDSVVVPERWRARGIDVDERDWIWTNQLAVWKKRSSSESGEEKSFKLDVIANEQLGEGKEHMPSFVIERFGVDKCRRGLGAMTWDLWQEGGEFRKLLLRYNARDSRILRDLERKKHFVDLNLALARLAGLPPEDRSMEPVRMMDGYMLRLGRRLDRRHPTRVRFESDEMPAKFKGAIVFPPRSVANENPKDDEEPWSREQAAAWRAQHGFKNGILHGVHVCDFSGMYPSIMMTFNLGAEVVAGWSKDPEKLKPGTCMSPGTGLVTRTDEKALITFAFEEMAAQRKQWADLAATLPPGTSEYLDAIAMSDAYKVAMNAFYGAGGTPYSRFYNRDVSEATTQNAKHFIMLAAREAEKRNMVVAYGDTDALCVVGPSSQGFARFVDWLNNVRFPEEVAKYRATTNKIKLAYEKSYERVIYCSKKRYTSAYLHYKFSTTCNRCKKKSGDPGSVDVRTLTCRDCGHVYDAIPRFLGKPEVKGIAFRRGDVMRLARDFQARAIDMLVGGLKRKGDDGKEHPVNPGMETPTEDVRLYRRVIEEMRDRVLTGDLPIEDIVERKGLTKSLREYGKKEVDGKGAKEVHVRVAKMMLERGEHVARGMQIEYVVVDGSVTPQRAVPASDYVGEADRYYLWDKVWSPTKQLLEAAFPDEDWDEWDAARPRRKGGKGSKAKAPEEQLGLALAMPTKMSASDDIAVPAYRAQSLRVQIPEAAGKEAIDRVFAVLKRHPGARSVEVVIKLRSRQEAIIQTPLRVSPGARLKAEIDEAIRGPAPS